MDKHDIAIELRQINKEYTIHHEKPTLVETFVKQRNERFFALKNVNVTIKKGEKVGFIGPNGSGKTTLLKIIAGITSPTSGSVSTHGKVVSLIDLNAGFHSDLSGYQNIYLNGLLLGMEKREIEEKYQSIISFADIGKFIDAPLFTYSSGMTLRLGFAIAAHSNPDILILDEALGVGDKDFQKKSQARIQEFFKKGKTIIVVSHWLQFIRASCDRVVIFNNGKIYRDGTVSLVDAYEKNRV